MNEFQEKYQEKLTTKQRLVEGFNGGDSIQLGVWYGEPYGVMAAIAEHAKDIDPLYISASISTSPSEYLELPGVSCVTGFFGVNERAARAKHGNVFYVPMHFTDGNRLIRDSRPHDYFVFRVAPMDDRGQFNFSLTASWEYNAIRHIKEEGLPTKIVFEVNPNLPHVYGHESHGNNELSIDYADIIVEDDAPILNFPSETPDEREQAIAANVAPLVEDKATVQLGFGNIPMAIGRLLRDRKELGIHTEMFCDSHIDLIEAGSVTNAHKGLYDGISVATFALGTPRLHEWLTENNEFAMLPVECVNNIPVVAKVNKMTSVNSVLSVDMTGQALAHCLGPRTYSGLGGAFEFAFGSQLSPGGKSVSCLPSTTTLKDGTVVSNIVCQFQAGARITLPEHCTDWVVTEHGAARLKCLPLEQRAEALINIAHPDFREDLAREMRDAGMQLDDVGRIPEAPARFFHSVSFTSPSAV